MCGPSAHTPPVPPQIFFISPTSLPVVDVELLLADVAVSAADVPDVIHLAVIVEEQRRIDAFAIERMRLRPRPGRIGRRHVEIARAPDVRRHHVERAVVVPQRRREHAARRPHLLERQLARPREHVPDLPPVDQILAVKDRHAGKILERAVDQIVVVAHAANARIGIEAREHRVLKRRRRHPSAHRSGMTATHDSATRQTTQ